MFVKKRALLIGVDDYEYEDVPPLKYCSHDVSELSHALRAHLGFDEADICRLSTASDDKPLRHKIFHELGRICDSTAADELLVFYFSGHGMVDKSGNDYLLPCDATPNVLDETAISVDKVAELLHNCASKHIVLFLDACREEVYTGAKGTSAMGKEAQNALDREGLATFFSCDPKDRSFEIDDLEHGSFTYCLLEAIKEGVHRDLKTLNHYFRQRVPQLNRDHKKPAQQPFLILNPADMGDLLFIAPAEDSEAPTEIDARIEQLDKFIDYQKLDEALYLEVLELLIRTRDQTHKSGDRRKLPLVSALLRKDVDNVETYNVEAFRHAWERIKRRPKKAPTTRSKERKPPV